MKKYTYLVNFDSQTLERVGESFAVKGDGGIAELEFIISSDFGIPPTQAVWRAYYKLPGERESLFETLPTVEQTESGDYVTGWVVTKALTQTSGRLGFSLAAISGNNIQWNSRTVIMQVQESQYQPESEEAEEPYTGRLDALEGSMASIRGEFAEVQDDFEDFKETATLGTPIPESLVANMQEGHVYIYTGTEPGYTAGHVYYYVGGALTDGGVYGGTAVDATLSQSGQAADAAAVGEALDDIDADVAQIKEDLSTKVSTVNGESPDVNGNVDVDTVIDANSVTYDMLYKSTQEKLTGTLVDYWYYQKNKRTDGKSLEFALTPGVVYVWSHAGVPIGAQSTPYFIADSDGTVYNGNAASERNIFILYKSSDVYYALSGVAGKLSLTNYFSGTTYFNVDTMVMDADVPTSTNFLKTGWEPSIMGIADKKPTTILTRKWYSQSGTLQGFGAVARLITYRLPYVGWYKHTTRCGLLDSDWNFIKSTDRGYFYNDGSYTYAQSANADVLDCQITYVGSGITAFGDQKVWSKGDQQNLNKMHGNAVVCFGDSITSTGYPSKLSALTDCVTINWGQSGNRSEQIRKFATGIGDEPATGYNSVFDWSANPVDTAIILAGWNDTNQGTIEDDIPATSVSDSGGDWATYLTLFDINTTAGNLGFMIEWIQAEHPDVRILLCNYHNSKNYPTRCADIDALVQALSTYYGVQMIDIRRLSGINDKNKGTYTTDGLHPNDAGQTLIAKAIIKGM